MNNYSDNQFSSLMAIAFQAKRLLLSEEVPDATSEVMSLCELIESYEAAYSEVEPKLRSHSKKSCMRPLTKKGRLLGLVKS